MTYFIVQAGTQPAGEHEKEKAGYDVVPHPPKETFVHERSQSMSGVTYVNPKAERMGRADALAVNVG